MLQHASKHLRRLFAPALLVALLAAVSLSAAPLFAREAVQMAPQAADALLHSLPHPVMPGSPPRLD